MAEDGGVAQPPAADRDSDEHDAPDHAGDRLPDDLDVTAYVGAYTFPDVVRRRWIGAIYLGVAAGCVGAWIATDAGAMLGAALLLGLIGVYHLIAGWRLRVDEGEALVVATRTVGFPIGHASAQLTWRGLRSRPTWRIVLFSADEPPSKRGLVELDAVDGSVLGHFTEDNPENW